MIHQKARFKGIIEDTNSSLGRLSEEIQQKALQEFQPRSILCSMMINWVTLHH